MGARPVVAPAKIEFRVVGVTADASLTGVNDPSGTLSLSLFHVEDPACAGPPAFTATLPVTGNGPYQSGTFTPLDGGTYRWTASYTGDAANNSVATGCTDTTPVAVFRPSLGLWLLEDGTSVAWGVSGDVPVPADYDGDGDADIAVFRPSTGVWFVEGGTAEAWGTNGDIPVPGDYDNDGTADAAIFRPSTGMWFGCLPAIDGDLVRAERPGRRLGKHR